MLADPGHAWKYGTSVRVAGGARCVSRGGEGLGDRHLLARRRGPVPRTHARVGRFRAADSGHARRELAARYDLDYLVFENDLPLPVAYRNEQFKVYALKQLTTLSAPRHRRHYSRLETPR